MQLPNRLQIQPSIVTRRVRVCARKPWPKPDSVRASAAEALPSRMPKASTWTPWRHVRRHARRWINAQAMRAMAMGGGGMPDMNAMMRMAMSRGGGHPGMAPPSQSDDVIYLCVADVSVTEQGKHDPARAYKMRSKSPMCCKNT